MTTNGRLQPVDGLAATEHGDVTCVQDEELLQCCLRVGE